LYGQITIFLICNISKYSFSWTKLLALGINKSRNLTNSLFAHQNIISRRCLGGQSSMEIASTCFETSNNRIFTLLFKVSFYYEN